MHTLNSGKLCIAAAPPGDSEKLLNTLTQEPLLHQELLKPTGVDEGYSVLVHQTMALNQRIRYGLGDDLPISCEKDSPHLGSRGIDLALSLHDIGKYLEGEKKNIAAEHARTLKIVSPYADSLPLPRLQRQMILDIIGSNTLGDYFRAAFPLRPTNEDKQAMLEKARNDDLAQDEYHAVIDAWELRVSSSRVGSEKLNALLDRCTAEFQSRAASLGVSAAALFRPNVVFYLADISAYTRDARAGEIIGSPSLDYILARNKDENAKGLFKISSMWKRLELSPAYEEAYLLLENTIMRS